jgi:regulator of sigma E protease
VQVLDANQMPQTRIISLASIDFEKASQDVMSLLGFTQVKSNYPVKIADVQSGGQASKAGMQINDLILTINQQKVETVQDFVDVINKNPNQQVSILIKRGKNDLMLNVQPEAKILGGKTIGIVGVAAQDGRLTKIDYSAWSALKKATAATWDTSIMSLKLMGKLVTGQLSLKNMSGPLTIANAAGDSAERGLKQFVGFLAFISISIGVMNLLPIPVLDGGHFMYYMAELLTGKSVPESAVIIGQKIGFLLLGLMMLVAFYNDINRLITG